MNVDLLSFCIKTLCLFSVKVRFSAEAAALLPKISFLSEENVTALSTKPLKTSEQSSDLGKNPAKTNQNTDSKGKPAKCALTASSSLMCIQQCVVVASWGPLGLELDAQSCVNLCIGAIFWAGVSPAR